MNVDRREIRVGRESDSGGSDEEENLRVSRSLKTFQQVLSDSLTVHWPSQCKVLEDRPRHIQGLPNKIEMFYDPTGKEACIQPLGEEYGSTVFNYVPKCECPFFSRSGVEEKLKSKFRSEKDPIPKDIQEDSLRFESRFESGNLSKAIRITDTYYELRLRPDLYTTKHCQWFYFRVQNMRAGVEYRFSFVNFAKPDSQYSVGMKPVLYSEMEAETNGIGWMRSGHEMSYFKVQQTDDPDKSRKYVMSFLLTFPHDNDTVYLAHCYPYRYSDMMEDLSKLRQDKARSKCFSQKVLCQTLCGNDVPLLTVTSPTIGGDMKNKQVVILTGRVHPGESPSSWIMRGIIHYLTGDTEAAVALRKIFIFKIVPMLNPDGVIAGNTRCNMTGADLNRQYKHTVKEAFPTVHHLKELVMKVLEDNIRITLYCDLHAHSRKYNVFMYGCENRKKSHKYLKEQIFPYMLHKNAKERFNFEDCRFTMQRSKESTGRIVFKNMGILNSFTLEASYGGSNCGTKAYSHFTPRDYQNVGRYFCETLLDFNDPSPPKEQLRYKILLKLLREKSTANDPTNVILSDYSSLSSAEEDYVAVSTSEVNDFLLFQNVKKSIRRKMKKKKLITPFSSGVTKQSSGGGEEIVSSSSSESISSSSGEEDFLTNSEDGFLTAKLNQRSRSARSSLQSFQAAGQSDLSDISEDEDAINVDVMRGFSRFDISHLPELVTSDGSEFSASACQRIHSELLASVNQIYLNLKDSGLKSKSASSSPLSGSTKKSKSKIVAKTNSVELRSNTQENSKKERSMSIAEITLKKSLSKKLKKKKKKSDIEKENKKREQSSNSPENAHNSKAFNNGKMHVIIKPKITPKHISRRSSDPSEL